MIYRGRTKLIFLSVKGQDINQTQAQRSYLVLSLARETCFPKPTSPRPPASMCVFKSSIFIFCHIAPLGPADINLIKPIALSANDNLQWVLMYKVLGHINVLC